MIISSRIHIESPTTYISPSPTPPRYVPHIFPCTTSISPSSSPPNQYISVPLSHPYRLHACIHRCPIYCICRQFLGGGEVTLEPDSENHIVPNGLLLSISQVRDGDQGDYVCAAANPAGEDRATTTLIIFGTISE